MARPVSVLQSGAIDVALRAGSPYRLRAVDYLRVSTEEQAKGYGIQYQGRKTTTHIGRKGWDHVGTYVDEGISGSLEAEDRPDLKRLMEEAAMTPRPFDVVTVNEGRAIGRTGRAFWRWVWTLEDMGIFVAIVDGDVDNTTPEGRREMRRSADYSETEWETIRKRTQGGAQEKAEFGGWTGGPPPFGWEIEDQGKKGLSRLVVNPKEAKIIWRVIELLRSGLKFKKIVARVNLEKLFTRSGRPWSYQNLRDRVFSEPVLYGYVTFRDVNNSRTKKNLDGTPVYGPSVRIPVPHFLSEDEMVYLRTVKSGRARGEKAARFGYPLSGRLYGLCGSHYHGHKNDKDGKYRNYECNGRKEAYPGAPVCSDKHIDATALEKHVWEQVCASFGSVDRLTELAADWVGSAQGDKSSHIERIADLDKQIEDMNAAITAVIISSAKAKQSADAIAAATAALNEELAQLEELRNEAAAWLEENNLAEERANSLLSLARDSKDRLPKLDADGQTSFYGLLDIRVYLEEQPEARRGGLKCAIGEWYQERKLQVPTGITDAEWAIVEPVLPRPGARGDVRRKMVETILDKAVSGRSWREAAAAHGAVANTVQVAWARWSADGVWAQVDALLRDVPRVPPRLGSTPLPAMRIEGVADPRLLAPSEESSTRSSWPAPRT
ncbi:recombinase family protein [Kitasatospora sp. NPDC001309]|uniref:recombinase family protein n=1 Tax=Kitasatospora sp. NPDC001309 TaxID=3364013 RepID=UPI0036958BE0